MSADSPLPNLSRRALLGGALLSGLGACSHPLPLAQAPLVSAAAAQRLQDSARAHGLDAYRELNDINIAYAGQWRPLIDRVQPRVVDAGYRGTSQERLLPAARFLAQAYTGPSGRKQVAWRRVASSAGMRGLVQVWVDGQPSTDIEVLQASALVAECYNLFLLGPLWLAERRLPLQLHGTERVDGRLCDVVLAWLQPGLGLSPLDRVALCIDQADHVTRRMRFTLEGTPNTQGAVAITDTFEHERRFGVLWPMRSYEEVVHPLRLPAHDWRITGLDVNRGYGIEAISGPAFTGAAAAPALAV